LQAICIDRKTQLAWLGHPQFDIIDNKDKDFEGKLNTLLYKVRNVCGIKTSINQVKKRFLVDITQS